MSIQGNTVTARTGPLPRRSKRLALPHAQDESGLMRSLLVVFLITLFIPKSVALQLGSVSLTPQLACSIILFPVLVFSGKIRFVWPDYLVVVFYLSTLYSTSMSAEATMVIEDFGRRVLTGMVPYLVGRYLGSRQASLDRFMRRMITVMAVLAIFTLFESLFRFNIHSVLWNETYDPHPERRLGLTRAYGWTSHSIMLGVSYAVFVPVAVIAAYERMNGFGGLRWAKFGLLMLGVFCSLSTGAWLPAFLALGLVVWDYFTFLSPAVRWLLMSLGSTGLYFVLEFASGRPLMRILMMELHLSSPTAWYYRWKLYERVYQVMPGYEWFGHGIKTPAAILVNNQYSIDNNYLVVLMQYGRAGLTLWIAIMVGVLVYGWKSVWSAADTPNRRIARAVMYAVVTVGLTQFSVAMFSTAAMLNWMFIGLCVGLAQGLAKQPVKKRATRPSPADAPRVAYEHERPLSPR